MDNIEERTLTFDEMRMINRLRKELCDSGSMALERHYHLLYQSFSTRNLLSEF